VWILQQLQERRGDQAQENSREGERECAVVGRFEEIFMRKVRFLMDFAPAVGDHLKVEDLFCHEHGPISPRHLYSSQSSRSLGDQLASSQSSGEQASIQANEHHQYAGPLLPSIDKLANPSHHDADDHHTPLSRKRKRDELPSSSVPRIRLSTPPIHGDLSEQHSRPNTHLLSRSMSVDGLGSTTPI